jgi:hypothetical protein
MPNTSIVIPTYWTWTAKEQDRPTTAAFDHPTPLDGESTLTALLDDLCNQRNQQFDVLILAGLAHEELGERVSRRMRTLLEPYRKRLVIRLCDAPTWGKLSSLIGLTEVQSQLSHLGSYSGIRNLQLLIPHILESEIIIALDDDERVQPDYVDRALIYIGKTIHDQKVLGLAGPYLQRDGSILLKEPSATGNPFLDKSIYINKAMRDLCNDESELKTTPLCLGGNMLIHRELFTRICFDPGITRGEDIDYLINARLDGIQWWFDANLTILHLPPHHYDTPAYQRTREDVFRFIYEREKLRLHGQTRPAWVEPYPGALLGDDMAAHALAALSAQVTPELAERFGNPEAIVEEARDHALRDAGHYFEYQSNWQKLMDRIEQDDHLRNELSDMIQPL